jgi:hypothetical protein
LVGSIKFGVRSEAFFREKIMAAGYEKKSVYAFAALLAMTTGALLLTTPQTASANIFDWLNQDPGPAPQYYPPGYPPAYPTKPTKNPAHKKQSMPGGPLDNGGGPNTRPPNAQPNDGGGELEDAKVALAEFRNQPQLDLPMYVVRPDWAPADEIQFAKFINQLGRAISSKQCNTVKTCMQSPKANMYAPLDAPGLVLYSDCADFPYFLRSYFAYHNGLPFGYVNSVRMNMKPVASGNDLDSTLATKREDTSPYGNTIVSRGGADTAKEPGWEPNYIGWVSRLFDAVSTRTFRVSPLTGNYSMSDVYPVKIDRQGIGPGTLVHTTGHLMVVWDVDAKGMVQAIDAHPDGTVQFKKVQKSTFDRSRPDQGLGFYRFRPMHLVGARLSPNGAYYGGKVTTTSDQDLYNAGLWSVEQWFGPGSTIAPGTKVDPSAYKSSFAKVDFFDYLATQMRDANVILQADDLVGDALQSLCSSDIQQRQATVNQALSASPPIPSMQHPSSIPADIFGEEDAVWGPLSSPGSDVRIRASIRDVIKYAVNQFRLAKSGDSHVRYDGTPDQYVASIRAKLDAIGKSCMVQYKNSVGNVVKLTMNDVISRADRISFDPYDCAEKRWGASGQELATCRDQDPKGIWYKAEQPIRNVLGKLTDSNVSTVRSNSPITIQMLNDPSLIDRPDDSSVNLGLSRPPIKNLDVNFASPKFIELLAK